MEINKLRELGNILWYQNQKEEKRVCDLTHNDWDKILTKATEDSAKEKEDE